MATEVCSETTSRPASPRLSFSHLSFTELDFPDMPAADQSTAAASAAASDFDFSTSFDISSQETSIADDIFLDGKLLPLPIKLLPLSQPKKEPEPAATGVEKMARPEELNQTTGDDDKDGQESANIAARTADHHRLFWRFGRSGSVNGAAGGEHQISGGICPFTLFRSRSTGSKLNPNLKEQPILNAATKKHSKNSSSRNSNSSSRNSNSTSNNNSNNPQFFRRVSSESNSKTYYYSGSSNSGGGGKVGSGGGVRISPVLNVPVAQFKRGGSTSSSSRSSGNLGILGWIMCN